jgi:phage terminase large subunit-like protein
VTPPVTDGVYFDARSVAADFAFIESLTLTKSTKSGKPEPFRLLSCHKKLVGNLLGWKRGGEQRGRDTDIDDELVSVLLCPLCKKPVEKRHSSLYCAYCSRLFAINLAGGGRIYRRAYFSPARKNAKTQIAAALGLNLVFLDGEASPEIYIAAKDRDQSSICFKAAAAMVDAHEELRSVLRVIRHRSEIVCSLNGGVLKALSSDGEGKHGYNPSTVIIDEFHVWGSAEQELYDALTSGSVARRQPLTIIITTAGVDEYTLCGREYDYACRVRDGIVHDPTYLPLIYELPKDADWTDEANWHLANPTLGEIVTYEALREARDKALAIPSEQTKFRRLNCNQWVNAKDTWIPLRAWDECSWNTSDPIPAMAA